MTPDELRKRCKQFMQDNDLHDGDERLRKYLGWGLESLCREMIVEGRLRMINEIGDLWDNGDPNNHEFVGWCRQEAKRVKENHETKKAVQVSADRARGH